MTFVGHSIVGATVAVAVTPKEFGVWRKALLVGSFIVLANFPDLKFPEWGHSRYYFSHSIFVNMALIAAALLPFYWAGKLRDRIGGVPVLAGAATSWMSHFLLDSFYNHGKGIAAYWPLNNGRLAFPIPYFETLKRADIYFDPHSTRVFLIEIGFYGSFFVLVQLVIFLRNQFTLRAAGLRGQ